MLDLAILDPDRLDAALPASLTYGLPLNLLASGQLLERLANEQPDQFSTIKAKLDPETQPPVLEVVGGVYREREDALLPVESQLWNLRKGRTVGKALLNTEINVYARKRTAFHPQTPQFLQVCGFQQALIFNFDNAVIPNHRAVVVNWPAPDGKSINAFTRMPLPAHSPQTFFNLVYSLHQAITQDRHRHSLLMHQGQSASPLYEDWLTLSKFGPVLGQWITFTRYFSEALAGDYTGPANADDFFNDYLEERINLHRPDPVSSPFLVMPGCVDASMQSGRRLPSIAPCTPRHRQRLNWHPLRDCEKSRMLWRLRDWTGLQNWATQPLRILAQTR